MAEPDFDNMVWSDDDEDLEESDEEHIDTEDALDIIPAPVK